MTVAQGIGTVIFSVGEYSHERRNANACQFIHGAIIFFRCLCRPDCLQQPFPTVEVCGAIFFGLSTQRRPHNRGTGQRLSSPDRPQSLTGEMEILKGKETGHATNCVRQNE
jgi:hypothetical protein